VSRVPLSALVLAGAAALSGCAVQQAVGQAPAPAASAGVRADTLTSVARRIYRQETVGAVGHTAVKRIARDKALLAALSSGNPATIRAAALRQLFNPGKHVVRLSVTRGGRTLTDVGGAFVVAPAHIELRSSGGADLGRLEASMQDVVGYVKLVHRLTGVQIVVRGAAGHVESSLTAATHAALPAAGTATVGGHRYTVRSFRQTGFGGEHLEVWILSH
jgi:hypothetical protein